MTTLRPGLPYLPARMRSLPIDERGYPVPYFVAMFCQTHKGCTPDTVITRIQFGYGATL